MSTDIAPLLSAAMGLPDSLRADLAAQLIASLDAAVPPDPQRTPEQWEEIIRSRSDAIHRREAKMIDGGDAIAMMRAVVEQTAANREVASPGTWGLGRYASRDRAIRPN